MTDMHIERIDDITAVVRLPEELTERTANAIAEVLDNLFQLERRTDIVLDLGSVTKVDGHGLAAIVNTVSSAQPLRPAVALANPRPEIKHMFQGDDETTSPYATVDEALGDVSELRTAETRYSEQDEPNPQPQVVSVETWRVTFDAWGSTGSHYQSLPLTTEDAVREFLTKHAGTFTNIKVKKNRLVEISRDVTDQFTR